MYSSLLVLHSLFRWLVLASLLFAIYRAYRGWFGEKDFSHFDNIVRHWTATIAHIQLIIALALYFVSPLISYFMSNFSEALSQREARFFTMEHSVSMLAAITVITVGSMIAKRKPSPAEKFKAMALWYSAALCIILIVIPWSFSPMVSRPDFRWF